MTTSFSLNELESFQFLLKSLWNGDSSKKFQCNITDTIIFRHGCPVRWLFTKDHNGSVMKKKNDRLLSPSAIVKSFRLKAQSIRGYSYNIQRNKIALVWFLKSDQSISTVLVDDLELELLLRSTITGILAIQVYVCGWPLKGSGVFEHNVTVTLDDWVHETYELIKPLNRNYVTILTSESTRLNIIDSQHEILKSFSRMIIQQIQERNKVDVLKMTFQLAFTSAWVPVLISAKSISLFNVPIDILNHKEKLIYIGNESPTYPLKDMIMTLLPNCEYETPAVIIQPETHAKQLANFIQKSNAITNNYLSAMNSKTNLNDKNTNLIDSIENEDDFLPYHQKHNPIKIKQNEPLKDVLSQITQFEGKLSQDNHRPITANSFIRRQIATAQDSDAQLHKTYNTNTVASKYRQSFYSNLIKPEDNVFIASKGRPSSAPTTKRYLPLQNYTTDSDIRPPGYIMKSKAGNPHPVNKHHFCYGDYCKIGQTTKTEKMLYHRLVDIKSADCPHQKSYKSILLARAEAVFLKADLDYDTDGLWRTRIPEQEVDQVLAYYTHRQIMFVLQLCNEKARNAMLRGTNRPPVSVWDDLNGVYRRLIYSEALAQVHPSRFYHNVPLCEICYKIYTMMDAQRIRVLYPKKDDIRPKSANKSSNREKTTQTNKSDYYHPFQQLFTKNSNEFDEKNEELLNTINKTRNDLKSSLLTSWHINKKISKPFDDFSGISTGFLGPGVKKQTNNLSSNSLNRSQKQRPHSAGIMYRKKNVNSQSNDIKDYNNTDVNIYSNPIRVNDLFPAAPLIPLTNDSNYHSIPTINDYESTTNHSNQTVKPNIQNVSLRISQNKAADNDINPFSFTNLPFTSSPLISLNHSDSNLSRVDNPNPSIDPMSLSPIFENLNGSTSISSM